jgi:serine phosphatase RsbU (regulator of sigma subunit)
MVEFRFIPHKFPFIAAVPSCISSLHDVDGEWMTLAALDPVLARQLKRLKIDPTAGPPPAEAWPQLLEAINEHYQRTTEDRALLNRSLELSTAEMDTLRRAIEAQRDHLSEIIAAISETLALFGSLTHADSNTGQVSQAKAQFTTRLQAILDDSKMDEHSSNSVSQIRTAMLRLADQLLVLLADTAERAAMKKELEVARIVQQLLVPTETVIPRPGVKLVGHFQPAAECGGDWWTVAELAGGRSLMMIGDVTGHGVAAAIITGAAKAACDLAVSMTGGVIEPNQLLQLMNVALCRVGRGQIMMTCLAMMVDATGRVLSIANAGHPNPVLVRQGIVHPLMAEGAPLGAALETTYGPIEVQTEPGDVLTAFTDGVTECENWRGEQFSERRFRAVCQRAAPGGAIATRDAILEAVATFRGDVAQGDDITFLAAGFR